MPTRHGTRLAAAALGATAGVLALADFHLLQGAVDITPITPPGGRHESGLLEVPETATPLDGRMPEQLKETADRPLFNPSRRPVKRNEGVAAVEPKAAPSKLRLIGVMKQLEEPPRALMRFANEPSGKWVIEGGEFKGWRLRTVKERSVIVEAGGRSQELMIATINPASPSPGPAMTNGDAERN